MENKKSIKKQNRFVAVSILITILVVVGTIWAAESFYKNDTTEEIKSNNESSLNLNSLIPETAEESADTETGSTEQTNTAADTTTNESGNTSEVLKSDITALSNPVTSTTVTMAFSYKTTPVFSTTFNEYRSDHTGIDIAAEIGEEVKCAYAGKVVEIRDDAKLGKTVKVEHAEGFYTEYSNLDDDIQVSVNDTVTAGQVLGKVGTSALYEIADAPHVHFAVIVNGEYVDPAGYLSF